MEPLKTNSHIHTPYSFSAFDSLEQAVALAREQGIAGLGISDFNTVEGYDEFSALCSQKGVYPFFNIETITIDREDKKMGLRWNDPVNPGTMYFCGKAFDYPLFFSQESTDTLQRLWKGTQDHIRTMIDKVNHVCNERGVSLDLVYETIRDTYAKNTVRERHLCKAIYVAMENTFPESQDRLGHYRKLFVNDGYEAELSDEQSVQNEIRGQLLKSGKPAYVEEDKEAFLEPEEARQLILDGGGIPCYPVFADDSGNLSEREADVDTLANSLIDVGVHMVEFIPLRNTFDHLKKYAKGLRERGFVVVCGTEHNTPTLIPMEPKARNGVVFDEELLALSYEGACVMAAHQESHRQGKQGFVSSTGKRLVDTSDMSDFLRVGDKAIRKAINL